jgi:hypothetical protein
MSKQYRPEIVLTGGRSGEFVVGLKGPPNCYVRGGDDRVFETDAQGKVVREISLDRVKSRHENASPSGSVFATMKKSTDPLSAEDLAILRRMGVLR